MTVMLWATAGRPNQKSTFKRGTLLVLVDDGHFYVTQGPPRRLAPPFYLAQTAVQKLVGPTSKEVGIPVTATKFSQV